MKPTVVFALVAILLALFISSCGREAPVGTLEIISTPAGASVSVIPMNDAGKSAPRIMRTPWTESMPVGSYRVAVEMDGFQVSPAERIVQVSPALLSRVEFGLARLGALSVTSTPPGAAVWIDGDDTGETTPHLFELTEGDHDIVLVLAGHVSDRPTTTVTVAGGATAELPFTLLPSGFVTVTSTPDGAAVSVDGAATGDVTPATIEIAAGDHTVSVARAGYLVSPESIELTVVAGATAAADFALVVEGSVGDLTVTSVPAGAAILIDDIDTGEVTPHTFSLAPVSYSVAVARRGFRPVDARPTTVIAADTVTEDFALTAAKVVLLETISGVNCLGCPAMNLMLKNLEGAGYGPDRMLGIKYSGPYGGPDLHYEANATVLQARQTYYQANTPWDWAAPTLFFDGDLAVAPLRTNGYPSYGDMVVLLEAALTADPGFAVDVAVVDYAADPIAVTIDLTPTREIAGSDMVLNLAIVESPVLYDEAPGSYGETEFHWICREFTQVSSSPLPIAPGSPGHFEFDLTKQANWTGVDPANLWAVAFVQNAVTLEVIQAGALAPTAHLLNASSPDVPTPERSRP